VNSLLADFVFRKCKVKLSIRCSKITIYVLSTDFKRNKVTLDTRNRSHTNSIIRDPLYDYNL